MLLIIKKIFFRKNSDMNDEKVRSKYGAIASIFSALINILLFSFKLLVGVLSNSISIIGDAINNLTDMGSSIISYIGFKISSKPADEDHPYGHQRVEYITSFIISVIVLIVGFQLLISSVNKIINKDVVVYSNITLIVLVISILIKLYLVFFTSKISKQINSITLSFFVSLLFSPVSWYTAKHAC